MARPRREAVRSRRHRIPGRRRLTRLCTPTFTDSAGSRGEIRGRHRSSRSVRQTMSPLAASKHLLRLPRVKARRPRHASVWSESSLPASTQKTDQLMWLQATIQDLRVHRTIHDLSYIHYHYFFRHKIIRDTLFQRRGVDTFAHPSDLISLPS
jgi:hypothetical protein